jgi:hypothetical protein
MRIVAVAVLLFALAACGGSANDVAAPEASQVYSDTLVLAPGQEVPIDAAFRVAFFEVSSDSRCASDVLCFWAGDAAVEIGLTVGTGPTHPFTLHTLAYPPASADYGGYRVTLAELTPYPISTRRIQPDEYRARLLVGETSNVQ